MPDNKLEDILKNLQEGMEKLFESDTYKQYLSTMSKFHNYSLNNSILIAMQCPNASLVAGYNSWQKQFKRTVNKGEKGIRILAPAPYKKKMEKEVKDINGETKKEIVEIVVPAFKPVTVFDVSQTSGEEIKTLQTKELLGTVEGANKLKEALINIAPVPIVEEEIQGGAKGYFSSSEKKIAIKKGMSDIQSIKTMIHETAHALLHDEDAVLDKEALIKKSRADKEIEAESVAYAVCSKFCIDTSDYSFNYLGTWANKGMDELKKAMDSIRLASSKIIGGIEDYLLKEEEKERLNLAAEIDSFAYEYDPYAYAEDVISTNDSVTEIEEMLKSGDTSKILMFLTAASAEEALPQIVKKAESLKARVEERGPAKKEREPSENKSKPSKEAESIKQRMERLKKQSGTPSSNSKEKVIERSKK